MIKIEAIITLIVGSILISLFVGRRLGIYSQFRKEINKWSKLRKVYEKTKKKIDKRDSDTYKRLLGKFRKLQKNNTNSTDS